MDIKCKNIYKKRTSLFPPGPGPRSMFKSQVTLQPNSSANLAASVRLSAVIVQMTCSNSRVAYLLRKQKCYMSRYNSIYLSSCETELFSKNTYETIGNPKE